MSLNVIYWISMLTAIVNTHFADSVMDYILTSILILIGAVALCCNIAADKVIKALANQQATNDKE